VRQYDIHPVCRRAANASASPGCAWSPIEVVPLVITRARGAETLLEVKEVVVGDWGPGSKPRRYVVCFNTGYRRFLATPREGHFEIRR
jgi:hypothetical protein